jgi:drug/metabolite transporter (DMT)-like permease
VAAPSSPAATRRPALPGVAAGMAGSLAFGITIVIGRSLARAGIAASAVLAIRFGIGGAVLLAILAASRRPLLPAAGERVAAVLLGGFGYSIESTFFYLGLAHGTASAVSLLFYVYPALVVVLELLVLRIAPARRTIGCLVLSAAGTLLVVVSAGGVRISTLGVVYALASAVSFAGYLLASERLLTRTDALTSGAWVTLGCAAAQLARAVITGQLAVPPGHWVQLAGYGAATSVAFVLMFTALHRLGSSLTAVIMTMEAPFAVVLAAIFLGESLGPLQLLGGAATLTAAVVIARTPAGSGHRHGAESPSP